MANDKISINMTLEHLIIIIIDLHLKHKQVAVEQKWNADFTFPRQQQTSVLQPDANKTH